MESTAILRFVNLSKGRTTVPGPRGQTVIIEPFEDSLDPRTRKADAVYVVEGAFWRKYVTPDGVGSQLAPFPRPASYGRESFPEDLVALRDDGEFVDAASGEVSHGGGDAAVQASPPVRRVAGDVITPRGLIRRTNPLTGVEELVPDIPENRNMRHSLDTDEAVNVKNPEIKDGIVAWMERMGIDSAVKLAALDDNTMLKIPGVTGNSLPQLRQNLMRYFRELEGRSEVVPTPVGESARTATEPGTLVGDDESAEAAQEEFGMGVEQEGDAVSGHVELPARRVNVSH
jgi:hypothetical protein